MSFKTGHRFWGLDPAFVTKLANSKLLLWLTIDVIHTLWIIESDVSLSMVQTMFIDSSFMANSKWLRPNVQKTNERIWFFCVTVIKKICSFVFWKNPRIPKSRFEIIWPLNHQNQSAKSEVWNKHDEYFNWLLILKTACSSYF